jgi:hypothetical protein
MSSTSSQVAEGVAVMGRPKLTPEEKESRRVARLAKRQEDIVKTPAHKFFLEFINNGIFIPGSHNNGHFVGVRKSKTELTESGEDVAIYIFEVMKSEITGELLRKPRFTRGGGRAQVVYPQMVIDWCQADGVARAILTMIGAGASMKQEVLSSDKVVVEETKAATESDELRRLSPFEV